MVDFSFSKQFTDLVTSERLKGQIREGDDEYIVWTPSSVTHVVKWQDEGYCHGTYERTPPPSFRLCAKDLTLIERNLVAALCDEFRSAAQLPLFDAYHMARSVKAGFEPVRLDDLHYTLRDTATDYLYPMRITEGSNEPLEPTYLSHIVTVPIEDLFAAYMDPNGAPLFSEFIEKRPPR